LCSLFLLDQILLERSHEALLLLVCLEATVAKLGRSIDEFEGDVLLGFARGVGQQGLAEGDDPLLGTHAAAKDHHEVIVDLSIVGESSHGSDSLLSHVVVGGSIVLDHLTILGVDAISDAVDLLVDLCTVMVALLASSGHRETNTGRMPGTNTGDLTQTLVRLAWQFLTMPSGGHTLESLALGDTNAINHLVLGEDILDGNLLLKLLTRIVHLLGDTATVELDFHHMSLLLALLQQLHLGVSNDSDDLAVLLHLGKVLLDFFFCPSHPATSWNTW